MLIQEDQVRSHFNEVINKFEKEVRSFKAGCITYEMLESIEIDTLSQYGVASNLSEVAKIKLTSQLRAEIEVWDHSIIKQVIKSLEESSYGFRVSMGQDKNIIMVSIPPITQETRENLVKTLSKIAEGYKVQLRQVRTSLIAKVDSMDKVSEDEQRRTKDKIHSLFKEYEKEIDNLFERKKKEILSI